MKICVKEPIQKGFYFYPTLKKQIQSPRLNQKIFRQSPRNFEKKNRKILLVFISISSFRMFQLLYIRSNEKYDVYSLSLMQLFSFSQKRTISYITKKRVFLSKGYFIGPQNQQFR